MQHLKHFVSSRNFSNPFSPFIPIFLKWHGFCSVIYVRFAIAEFEGRVAPRLEHANSFIFVELENGQIKTRQKLMLPRTGPWSVVEFLKARGVDLVLCGALLPQTFHLLAASGIGVFWGIVGGIDEVISSFLAGVYPYPPPARKRWRWGKGKKWR